MWVELGGMLVWISAQMGEKRRLGPADILGRGWAHDRIRYCTEGQAGALSSLSRLMPIEVSTSSIAPVLGPSVE